MRDTLILLLTYLHPSTLVWIGSILPRFQVLPYLQGVRMLEQDADFRAVSENDVSVVSLYVLAPMYETLLHNV